jgi:hypothetical protein
VADAFRRFGPAYLEKYGHAMLPSHRRALEDILSCRTEVMGGHLYRCEACGEKVYAYHSCRNRACPTCHTDQTRRWIEKRQPELLPIGYFHVTATAPQEVRPLLRSHQKDLYGLLMKAAGQAILRLAPDTRYVGGEVGILQVFHTWTGALLYHPHVHCLVTGGGVSADRESWLPARENFLVPVLALSPLVRGKFCALLRKHRPDLTVPTAALKKKWVVHCTPWGEGPHAVLRYLARYVFRIALSNARMISVDEETVTFRGKDRRDNAWKIYRLSGEEFLRRFLQHVVPKGFHKVRYLGLWHHARRPIARRIRLALLGEHMSAKMFGLTSPPIDPPSLSAATAPPETVSPQPPSLDASHHRVGHGAPCPHCRLGRLIHVARIPKSIHPSHHRYCGERVERPP